MTAGNAASFIRNFDDNVLVKFTVRDDDPNRGHLTVYPVPFNSGSHRIFEELNKAITNVGWNVWKSEIGSTVYGDLRSISVGAGTNI